VTRATAAESRYLGRVATLRCALCSHLGLIQDGRTFVHHIKEGTGIGERSQHFLVAALCQEHHQGAGGIHGLGTKGFYSRYRLDEMDLLAMTIKALNAC
jgi:RecA-dependent nuclease